MTYGRAGHAVAGDLVERVLGGGAGVDRLGGADQLLEGRAGVVAELDQLRHHPVAATPVGRLELGDQLADLLDVAASRRARGRLGRGGRRRRRRRRGASRRAGSRDLSGLSCAGLGGWGGGGILRNRGRGEGRRAGLGGGRGAARGSSGPRGGGRGRYVKADPGGADSSGAQVALSYACGPGSSGVAAH